MNFTASVSFWFAKQVGEVLFGLLALLVIAAGCVIFAEGPRFINWVKGKFYK